MCISISTLAGKAAMLWTTGCRVRGLFILERDFQGGSKPCDELSDVILPVGFFRKVAALAPARTEIISEWLVGLRRRNGQQVRNWRQSLAARRGEIRLRRLGQRGA